MPNRDRGNCSCRAGGNDHQQLGDGLFPCLRLSHGKDRRVKSRLYAEARIPEDWLIDLHARVLARQTQPAGRSYTAIQPCRPGDSIAPDALPGCVLALGD